MSKKIKILYPVGSLYPDESGGVSLTLYWLLQGLYTSDKIETKVITTSHGIQTSTIEQNKWLDTNYGRVIYLTNSYHKLAFPLLRTFWQECKSTDIVHLSSIFYPPSICCYFISLYFKKKVIWSTHGSIDDIEFLRKGLLKRLCLYILRFFTNSTVFHTTSASETEFVHKRFGFNTKVIQITNYVALPQPKNSSKEDFFLYIGRFHPKKGIENLLRALNISKEFNNSKFSLKIAGDYENEYGKTIIDLHKELHLQSKVAFLGAVTGDDKQNLLSKANFMFIPSFSENFGVVVAEALAQHTPVVASVHTPWQILNTYRAGFWIDNSPEALAQIIDKIITMPQKDYEQITVKTRELVDKELNIFTNIHTWLNAYLSFKNV